MKIKSVMSPSARKIPASATLQEALDIFGRFSIRHLPVVDGEDIIGVLTESDTRLALAVCSTAGSCPAVGKVCRPDPYVVGADDPVSDVVRKMADKKYDCALVADDEDNFVGIVTTTDVCRLLSLMLDETGK